MDEDAEDAAVFAVVLVELEEKDCGCVVVPFLATRTESRKDLA